MSNNNRELVENLVKEKLLAAGFIASEGGRTFSPPIGMGEFAAQDIIKSAYKDAEIQISLANPYWHEQNPWKDHLMYVPIEELAPCMMAVGNMIRLNNNELTMCDEAFVLNHWHQHGDKLDGYILTGKTFTAGVRFGPDGPDYISPGFSTPKLWALMNKYKSLNRRSYENQGGQPAG